MTNEGLERLMRAIDDEVDSEYEAFVADSGTTFSGIYGRDYPPCANCGHAPKEHGGTAMKCEAFLTEIYVTDRAHGYWTAADYWTACDVGPSFRRERPCPCDCYDEPEESRLAHSR